MGDAKLAGIAAEDIGKAAYGIFKARLRSTSARPSASPARHLTIEEMGEKLSKGLGHRPGASTTRVDAERCTAASDSRARTNTATCSRSTATSRRK